MVTRSPNLFHYTQDTSYSSYWVQQSWVHWYDEIMQKEIYKEDYFGTLMCILVDESRRIMSTFNPTPELHKIQNDMCIAGTWIDHMPAGTIVESVPQESIRKLQEDALPEYRRLAANLIDKFIDEFEAQGGRRIEITEKFERMYKWKQ